LQNLDNYFHHEIVDSTQATGGRKCCSSRREKGWSQEELGERADLGYKCVGEVERGTVNPSLDSLEKIANALAIEVAALSAQGPSRFDLR